MRKTPLLASLLAGFLSTPFTYFLALVFGLGAGAAYSIWLTVMYPVLMILVFFLGYQWPFKARQYGFLAVMSSYVGALIFIPGAGNLLPFEIVAQLFYSIPAVFAGWLGAYLSIKFNDDKSIKSEEIDLFNKMDQGPGAYKK